MHKSSWTLKKAAKEIVILAAMFFIIYFGNQQVQTWLGKRAIAAMDFEVISFDAALEQAQRENKPILADFSAVWCPSCRKLDTRILAQDDIRDRILEDYVFVRLEYESDDRALFQQYNVNSFPTLLVLDQNGNFQRKLSLSYNQDAFASQL